MKNKFRKCKCRHCCVILGPICFGLAVAAILYCCFLRKLILSVPAYDIVGKFFIRLFLSVLLNCLAYIIMVCGEINSLADYDCRTLNLPMFQSIIQIEMAPHSKSVDEELNEAAKEVREKMKTENDVVLDPEYLQRYAIADEEGEFEKALENGTKVSSSGILSVKSNRTWNTHRDHKSEKGKRKGKHGDKSRWNKKKRT